MKIPSLRNAVKGLYLKLVDEQCSRLCLRTTAEPSVLRVPSAQHKNLVEFKWEAILKEMEERAPDVLDFLVAMAIPKLKGNDGRQVIPLCTAYGILMNVRCRELSLVQKNQCRCSSCWKCYKKSKYLLVNFTFYSCVVL